MVNPIPYEGTDQGEIIDANDPLGALVYGYGGNDTIYTGSADDEIYGGPGDDIISTGQGTNTAHGDDGDDEVRGAAGRDILYGDAGDDLIYGGQGGGDDDIYGGDGKDELHGTEGDDKIWGGEGDDYLLGGTQGDDMIWGGAGKDWIYGGGKQLPSYQIIYGGDGDDRIAGDDGDDLIYGDAGNDLLYGSHDLDEVYGGAGRDSVHGNYGDDVLYGGKGKDEVIGAQADDIVYGDGGGDDISGNSGTDKLFGGSGNDVLSGGAGNDILDGGSGRDEINGNGGIDTLSYEEVGGKGVRIDVTKKKYGGEARSDDIRNVDNVIGSQSKDVLTPAKGGYAYGAGGSDVIKSAGAAVMRGDEGGDKLIGGKKKDVFWLQPAEYGADDILNFKSGQDKLRIKGSDFGVGDGLSSGELVNRSSGHDAEGSGAQLIYDQSTKTLWFDADGTGAAAAEKIAGFGKGAPGSLSTNDFDVI